MPSYQTKMVLQTTCERAFKYLSTPANLGNLTMPELQLTVEDGPEQFAMESTISFSIHVMGARIKSVHKIISFDAPHSFVEEQVDGPFSVWKHEHLFKPLGENEIAIYDVIEYEPPGGLVGLILSEDRIRSQLDEGFAHRQDELKYLLENDKL
ncbi:MAG: hypothetical protein P8M30_18665 [Planctomycetaceae bacterium]|jgi:ligand-binding SRPBCC domain-containing protein|nr:hypothetical protein [Planctomycetaceae bacterium]